MKGTGFLSSHLFSTCNMSLRSDMLARFGRSIQLSDGREVQIEKGGKKLNYTRTMKANLEDVTVATDGFQCLQLRWEDGNVWTWVNPAKVQADLKAAVDKSKESEAEVASLHLDMNQVQRQMDIWEISPCLSLYFVG